ncbi:alpha/beta hydrolase fold domain-containing protein [Streptomyces sp. ActVer]|uniref:alpha/beta hydrolase fold domain-containing protein n=1 Tax=Streptomyces sp. ActVer TaxID=3014558 RepID=UPI0034DD22E4
MVVLTCRHCCTPTAADGRSACSTPLTPCAANSPLPAGEWWSSRLRLTPENPYPTAVEDALAASAAWLTRNAADLNAGGPGILVGGDSAGVIWPQCRTGFAVHGRVHGACVAAHLRGSEPRPSPWILRRVRQGLLRIHLDRHA